MEVGEETSFLKFGAVGKGKSLSTPSRTPAPLSSIRPGDWLYYVNHSYGNIEHSGLFIGWTNRAAGQGLILSYQGERRNKPGRYRVYDLSSVYQILRAR